MKIIWICIILSLFTLKVFATDEVVTITALGADHSNVVVNYDSELLKGFTNDEISALNIDQLYQKINGEYVRRKGYGDRVFVLPGSNVGIYAFTKNFSQLPVEIYDYRLFLSRTNYINGDLTWLGIQSDGIYSGRKFAINSVTQTLVPNESIEAYRLYSFDVIQPINIQNYSVTNKLTQDGVGLEFTLILENSSEYNLCNIELLQKLPSGRSFNKSICLAPHSSVEITYTDTLVHPISSKVSIESLNVKDNNWHYESISTQQLNEFDKSLEATSMILNSSLGQYHALGSSENNITVVRIPYSINSEVKDIEFETELEINSVSVNGNTLILTIFNKGVHLYNANVDINLFAPNLELFQETLLIDNLYFGQTQNYIIPIKSDTNVFGEFSGIVQLILDQQQYEHTFEYSLVKDVFVEKNKSDRSITDLSGKIIPQKLNVISKSVVPSKAVQGKSDNAAVLSSTTKDNSSKEESYNNNISDTLLKLGFATFIIFILIIFILIWLW